MADGLISKRFARSRDVGAHFGPTPRKYASGEIDRNGTISKIGDRLAREALFIPREPVDADHSVVGAESLGHRNCQAAWVAPSDSRWHGPPGAVRIIFCT
jgi:transposase